MSYVCEREMPRQIEGGGWNNGYNLDSDGNDSIVRPESAVGAGSPVALP